MQARECSGHAEPAGGVRTGREDSAAHSRADDAEISVPGTATHNTPTTVSGQPRSAIGRRAAIVDVPAIFSPIHDIAKHIVEAVLVRRKTSNRRRECIPVAACSIHVAIARMLLTIIQITNIGLAADLRRIIATVTRRRRSRARRVFPLSLRW